ncbi:UNVERIFIED_CONTAM: hypothetical protein FKN15_013814 [Acipenser sinensis]
MGVTGTRLLISRSQDRPVLGSLADQYQRVARRASRLVTGGAAEPQEAGSDAVLRAESQTKVQDTAKDNESAESHGTEGESEQMDTETVASVWGDVQIQVEGVKFAEDSEAFRLPGKKRVSKTEGSAVTKKVAFLLTAAVLVWSLGALQRRAARRLSAQ